MPGSFHPAGDGWHHSYLDLTSGLVVNRPLLGWVNGGIDPHTAAGGSVPLLPLEAAADGSVRRLPEFGRLGEAMDLFGQHLGIYGPHSGPMATGASDFGREFWRTLAEHWLVETRLTDEDFWLRFDEGEPMEHHGDHDHEQVLHLPVDQAAARLHQDAMQRFPGGTDTELTFRAGKLPDELGREFCDLEFCRQVLDKLHRMGFDSEMKNFPKYSYTLVP